MKAIKNKPGKQKKKDPYASQRRSWDSVNPVTRVHPDKTKYKRNKRINENETK